jgi:nucleotide-binding universal stress UspA family protein
MTSRDMHRGILAGVDGSAPSNAAVRWAAREAAMRNVPLVLIHARTTPTAGVEMTWPALPVPEDLTRRQEEEARQVVADAVNVAESELERSRIDTKVVLAAPIPTLVDLTKDVDMIVVGCRGQGALARTLLGSVSTALVHHAHCPVAVIHDEAPERPDGPVLVGIDGSPSSELATAIAFDEASWRGATLVAMHAWNDADASSVPSLEWSALEVAADKTLAERLAGWSERYPDVPVRRVVVWEYAARHLIERADTSQLVVVGSRGRGGFAGMLLGSVSTAVVHGAHVPVIVARRP